MLTKARVFLDTSALFAGIWSASGGSRMILRLGELGAIRLLVSPQVLEEIERTLRRKAPNSLGTLALLLDRSRVEVVLSPPPRSVLKSPVLTGHLGDAQVLAAAWAAGSDRLARRVISWNGIEDGWSEQRVGYGICIATLLEAPRWAMSVPLCEDGGRKQSCNMRRLM